MANDSDVRRELVAEADDRESSNARWFAGVDSVKIAMDRQVLAEVQWE